MTAVIFACWEGGCVVEDVDEYLGDENKESSLFDPVMLLVAGLLVFLSAEALTGDDTVKGRDSSSALAASAERSPPTLKTVSTITHIDCSI